MIGWLIVLGFALVFLLNAFYEQAQTLKAVEAARDVAIASANQLLLIGRELQDVARASQEECVQLQVKEIETVLSIRDLFKVMKQFLNVARVGNDQLSDAADEMLVKMINLEQNFESLAHGVDGRAS